MPKQHVLTLELKQDKELIRLYEQYHRPGEVWPEVLESIRASGIESIQIYRLGTLLVMVLSVSDAFSFEVKAKIDRKNTKVQEWEKLMERFQKAQHGYSSQVKWRPLNPLFQFHSK